MPSPGAASQELGQHYFPNRALGRSKGLLQDDTISADLISVRDARQQRLDERASRTRASSARHSKSSSNVGQGPSYLQNGFGSLAAAFKRPPPDRFPVNRGVVHGAAAHVAASLGLNSQRSSNSNKLGNINEASTLANCGSATADEVSHSDRWVSERLQDDSSATTSHRFTPSSTGHASHQQAGGTYAAVRPPSAGPSGRSSTSGGATFSHNNRSSAAAAGGSSIAKPGSSRSAAQQQQQQRGNGRRDSGMPAHLAQLLAEPPPLLQLPEDGDAATAMMLYEAREQGVCQLTMRGLQQLPQALLRFLRVEGLNLRELRLQGNRLTALPPLEQVGNLQVLDLSSNCLPSLPDCLGALSRLTSLVLAENRLAHLPPSTSLLSSLTLLDLSCNELQELPQGLDALQMLQHVQVDRNRLHSLPAALLRLPSLRSLTASHNELVAVSADLGCLKQLERLSLHHNRMTALPDSVGELRRCLTELLLNDNCLTVLPRELAHLSQLQHLSTGCNPLIFPPQEVARKGWTAVRNFLMQHLDHWDDAQPDGSGSRSREDLEESELTQQQRQQQQAAGVCRRCKDLDDQLQRTGSQMLRIQLERERAEKEVQVLRSQVATHETRSTQLDSQVKQLLQEKLASERSLHARSAQHLASAEDLDRQVLTLRVALYDAEAAAASAVSRAKEAEERRREAEEQGEVDRRRAAAAVAAAGANVRATQKAEGQQAELQACKDKIMELQERLAHHLFQQKASEDRQLEAEAKADGLQAELQGAAHEAEATRGLMETERQAALLQQAEAQRREQALQIENERLRAQLAALLEERQALQQYDQADPRVATKHWQPHGGSIMDHVVAPSADTVIAARRAQSVRVASASGWRLPQQL